MSPRLNAAEEFARLLDLPVGTTPSGADGSMLAMTNLAGALRAVGQTTSLPGPDADFRAALRQRLVAVATVQVDEPVGTSSRRQPRVANRAQRRIAAFASVFAVSMSVVGVGVAASRSLPGQPFYGIKRATEAVQLWTARGDEAKGRRHLEFAQTRLAEIQKLSPTSSHIASTLASMNAETKAGSAELISSYQSSHSTAPLATLVTFTKQQTAGLNQLSATLPPALQPTEVASLQLLGGVTTTVKKVAKGVCILCTPSGGSTAPTQTPTPSPDPKPTHHPSSHPSKHPNAKHSKHHGSTAPSRHPSAHASQSAGTSTSPSSKPTHPTILPTGILSSILNPKPSPSSKSTKPAPIPSVLSSLLGGLGLG